MALPVRAQIQLTARASPRASAVGPDKKLRNQNQAARVAPTVRRLDTACARRGRLAREPPCQGQNEGITRGKMRVPGSIGMVDGPVSFSPKP